MFPLMYSRKRITWVTSLNDNKSLLQGDLYSYVEVAGTIFSNSISSGTSTLLENAKNCEEI